MNNLHYRSSLQVKVSHLQHPRLEMINPVERSERKLDSISWDIGKWWGSKEQIKTFCCLKKRQHLFSILLDLPFNFMGTVAMRQHLPPQWLATGWFRRLRMGVVYNRELSLSTKGANRKCGGDSYCWTNNSKHLPPENAALFCLMGNLVLGRSSMLLLNEEPFILQKPVLHLLQSRTAVSTGV